MDSKFDQIRPYFDMEIPSAIERMLGFEYLGDIADFLKISLQELSLLLKKCKNVDDFQNYIMANVVSLILQHSAADVTVNQEGLSNFDNSKKFLIVSNHRDIVMDSAIIQLLLHNNNYQTTESAVGDNLISSQFIEDVARSNKMIKVTRNTTPMAVYNASKLLSEYIRERVSSGGSSIWIAQRNGRTKNGNDATEQGVLKMLSMSGKGDFIEDVMQLNILPMAISYEYEPCDIQKVLEVYIARRHKYVKSKDEDLASIIAGMVQWKGEIHIGIADPISFEEVEYCSQFAKNERFTSLAKIIDKKIHSSYKLRANNYIASDIIDEREGKGSQYTSLYTEKEKSAFIEYMNSRITDFAPKTLQQKGEDIELNMSELEDIFLRIYANPLYNSTLQ